MFYGAADKKLYRKIKSMMPFLPHKRIDFLIDCYNLFLALLPGLLLLIMLCSMLYFIITSQVLSRNAVLADFCDTLRRNEVIADFGWVHSNEGKTFVGYVPVTYERDIHVKRGDSPKEVITAGCSVSEGVDHAKRIYIRGIYPNKDEALDFLHKHSTGSRVTVFWEEGERVYRVREDMLEVGFFRVSDSYVPWYDAELVEHLDYEAFQPGQVESGSY